MINLIRNFSYLVCAAGLIVSSPSFAFKKETPKTTVLRLDNTKGMQAVDLMTTGAVIDKNGAKAAKNVNAGTAVDVLTTGSVARENELMNYCYNISDSAVEARSAVLKEQLEVIEKQVEERLVLLEEKTKELKEWMVKRESFVNKVNNSVVQIFQAMRPDAAASQFTELGPVVSASIISQLPPKASSAILTEMSPTDAAEVALVLTAALDGAKKNEK